MKYVNPGAVLFLAAAFLLGSSYGATGVVQAFVYSLVGSPVYHAESKVKLDPYVGQRRNPGFEALHGHKAVHLIERLGLGMDGREAERLEQQRIRDATNPYENQNTNYFPSNL